MKKTALALALAFALISCEKEPEPATIPTEADAYVLNEGLWGNNNASISLLNSLDGNIFNDIFAHQNGRGLGDVAQDALIYGGKMYIAVSGSKTLEVVDAATCQQITTLRFQAEPRGLACADGCVYVSCYNKHVYRLDTLSLTFTGDCVIPGYNLEGLAVSGDRLYVCSSWRKTSSGEFQYDNRLFAINLASFTREKSLPCSLNPQRILALDDGRLLYCYSGNYADAPAGLALLNPQTEQETDLGVEATGFDVYQGRVYLYHYDWDTTNSDAAAPSYHVIDLATLQVQPLTLSGATIVTPYGLNVNPKNGDILITDAQRFRANGDVHCFSPSGAHKWSAEAQAGPSKVVFLK